MKHEHTHRIATEAYHLLKWQVSAFTLADNPIKTPMAECNRLNFDYRFRSDFFFFLLCQISLFFCYTFFANLPSHNDCSLRFHATIQQCPRPMQCMFSIRSPEEKKNNKPRRESNSNLVKRRQCRHTWLDGLMVKLHIKYLALFAYALAFSVASKQVTLFAKSLKQ